MESSRDGVPEPAERRTFQFPIDSVRVHTPPNWQRAMTEYSEQILKAMRMRRSPEEIILLHESKTGLVRAWAVPAAEVVERVRHERPTLPGLLAVVEPMLQPAGHGAAWVYYVPSDGLAVSARVHDREFLTRGGQA